MSSEVALWSTLAFVAVLLLTDGRRSSQVSLAIWLPTLWMMYCGSRPLAYWFDPASVQIQGKLTEGSPIDSNFLSVLLALAVIVLITRKLAWRAIIKDNLAIFVFFSFMLLSVLWSDLFEVSLKRWIRTAGDLAMVLLILSEPKPIEAAKTVIRRSAYVLLPMSILLIKYFRNIGVAYTENGSTTMWIGVTTHKNVLGYVMMVCVIYFIGDLLATKWRRRAIDLVFLAMITWLFVGTDDSKGSQTSLSALGIALCALGAGRWLGDDPARLKRAAITVTVAAALFALLYQTLGDRAFDASMTSLGRDATLTGRTEIWNIVLDVGPGNFLLGRGYGSFWSGSTAEQVWDRLTYHTHFTQSHNGYIDIYLELGVIGLFLLAWMMCSVVGTFRQTFAVNVEYGAYRLAFFTAILVHNLTESSYGRPTHLLWFVFLLTCVYVREDVNSRVRSVQAKDVNSMKRCW